MPTKNSVLEAEVKDQLAFDPKIDSKEIAVSAKDGVVMLRGTVGSFRQKREATKTAHRVRGAVDVVNELDVRILTDKRREDAELRGDVLQALMLDSLVPKTIDAKAKDGHVTLKGVVDWEYQRSEAEFISGNIAGVTGVKNDITLTPRPNADDVDQAIKSAFDRDADIDADHVIVTTSKGRVTLDGSVRSWSEHNAALAAAWAAPGVSEVDDRLTVTY